MLKLQTCSISTENFWFFFYTALYERVLLPFVPTPNTVSVFLFWTLTPGGVLFLSLAIKRQNPLPSQALVLTQFIITSCVSITSFYFYFSFKIDTLTEKHQPYFIVSFVI